MQYNSYNIDTLACCCQQIINFIEETIRMQVWIFLFSILTLIYSYDVFATNTVTKHNICNKQSTIQTKRFPAFTNIFIEGNINVNLINNSCVPYQIKLQGNRSDLAQINTAVNKKILYISLGKGYPHNGALVVTICTKHLNAFNYRGRGSVIGKNIYSKTLKELTLNNAGRTILSGNFAVRKLTIAGGGYAEINGISGPHLQLSIIDSNRVQLTGVININQLNLAKKARLTMYWIKSNALIIRAQERAFMQLAGVVGKLDVELCNFAHFNGRYLRSNTAFIKTHDRSIADIAVVSHQHTLATDTSDIYFYNLPGMRTDFMAYDGSVLDMRDLSFPDVQEYDIYNK